MRFVDLAAIAPLGIAGCAPRPKIVTMALVVDGSEVTLLACKEYYEFIEMFFGALLSRASLFEEPNPGSRGTDGD